MTLSEWKEWKANPQTSEFFQFLARLREEIKEDWAQSYYVGESDSETVQRNAAALGQVDLLGRLQYVTFESVEESKVE